MTAPDPLPFEACLAAIAGLPDLGPVRLRRLLAVGSPPEVWARLRGGTLPPVQGVDRALSDRWAAAARSLDPVAVWARCADLGVGVARIGAPNYPSALLEDPEPPVVLFHLGDLGALAAPRVAVVGTRRATPYGLDVARRLGAGLAAHGVCVVSGLALGIDAAAHAGAVSGDADAQWAPPAAVVGSGLDSPCPSANLPLARAVAGRGVVVSEVPPGVPAAPWRFPVRNRIIAGLAEVVVVVESAGAGGSMHTVREALERGRTVLAVPGPVDSPVSVGPHELLAEGAGVCTGVDDVLDHLPDVRPLPGGGPAARPRPTGLAAELLERLGWLPVAVGRAVELGGADVGATAAAMASLERDGWIELRDGAVVRRSAG